MTSKFPFYFLILSLVFSACGNGDNDLAIAEEQRAVIAYLGATWCPPCGEYGGPLLDQVDQDIETSKAIILSFQSSDDITPVSSDAAEYAREISDVTAISGIPRIFIGGGSHQIDRGLFSSLDTNMSRLSDDVDEIIEQQPIVGVNGRASLVEDKVNVEVGLKFFSEIYENYYVGTYLLEDNIIADQRAGSIASPTFEEDVNHNHIVRANQDGSSSYLGNNVGPFSSAEGRHDEDFEISIPVQPNNFPEINKANLKVAIVVWRGDGFAIENGILLAID